MSDKLENFIRNNRDGFDANVPSDQIWNNIQAGIAQQAAAGASAGTTAATTAKSGLAKIALGWKIAAVTAFTAIVATGIYLGVTAGDNNGKTPEPLASAGPEVTPPPTSQVEYIYEGSSVVAPPMEGVDVPYGTFTVPAAKGGTWTAPSGSLITVPEGTFVDANGNPVQGDVEIRYREFHDAADVILSGITMKYNEKGGLEDFQTAGMVEILGYQQNKAVFIAPGKSIEVKMASFTPEDNYNLYFLDKENGWKDIGKAKLSKNKDKEEGMRILATKPRPPLKGKDEEMDGEVTFNANYDKFPELKPFKGVRWMAEDILDYSAKEDMLITKVWTDVELVELDDEGLRYRFNLTSKSGSKLSIEVKPILEGADYEKGMARFQEKMDKYNKVLKEKGIEEERLARQADVFRSFSVSGFGIYNCDRFYRGGEIVSFTADFSYPEDAYIDPAKTLIYHIAGENRAVIVREPETARDMRFVPSETNFLVVVLSGNKVAVVGPDQFKKIAKNRPKVAKVEFETQPGTVTTAADLRTILGV